MVWQICFEPVLYLVFFCSRSTRTWTSSSWRTGTGWMRFQMMRTWISFLLKQSTLHACAARQLPPQPVKSSSTPILPNLKSPACHLHWCQLLTRVAARKMNYWLAKAQREKQGFINAKIRNWICTVPVHVPPMVGSVHLTSALLVQQGVDWWQKNYL